MITWRTLTLGSNVRYGLSKLRNTDAGPIRAVTHPSGLEFAPSQEIKSNAKVSRIGIVGEIPHSTTDWVRDKRWDILTAPHFESIIGSDDRNPVQNPKTWPYCAVGALGIEFPQGRGSGSASLIDDAFILTAGHCVYLAEYGGWIRGAKFAPGAGSGNQPFGLGTAVRVWVPEPWVISQDSNFDFAIIALDKGFASKVGAFGIAALNDSDLARSDVLISGYPSDKGGMDQYYAIDKLISVDSARVHYLIDSFRGQSGTGVVRKNGDDFSFVVGVHTYGTNNENSGIRITADRLREIDKVISGGYAT